MPHFVFRTVKTLYDPYTWNGSRFTPTTPGNGSQMLLMNDYVFSLDQEDGDLLDYIASVLVAAESYLYGAISHDRVSIYRLEIGEKITADTPCKVCFEFHTWDEIDAMPGADFNRYARFTPDRMNGNFDPSLPSANGGTLTPVYKLDQPGRPANGAGLSRFQSNTCRLDAFMGVVLSRNVATGHGRQMAFRACLGVGDYYWTPEGRLHLCEFGAFVQCRFPAFQSVIRAISFLFSTCYLDKTETLVEGANCAAEFNLVCATDFSAQRKRYYKNYSLQVDVNRLNYSLNTTVYGFLIDSVNEISKRKDLFWSNFYHDASLNRDGFANPISRNARVMTRAARYVRYLITLFLDGEKVPGDIGVGNPATFSRAWRSAIDSDTVNKLDAIVNRITDFETWFASIPLSSALYGPRYDTYVYLDNITRANTTWCFARNNWMLYAASIADLLPSAEYTLLNAPAMIDNLRKFSNFWALMDNALRGARCTLKGHAPRLYPRAARPRPGAFPKRLDWTIPATDNDGTRAPQTVFLTDTTEAALVAAYLTPGATGCPLLPWFLPRFKSIQVDAAPFDPSSMIPLPLPDCAPHTPPIPSPTLPTVAPHIQSNCANLRLIWHSPLLNDGAGWNVNLEVPTKWSNFFKEAYHYINSSYYYDRTCKSQEPRFSTPGIATALPLSPSFRDTPIAGGGGSGSGQVGGSIAGGGDGGSAPPSPIAGYVAVLPIAQIDQRPFFEKSIMPERFVFDG